MRSPRALTVPAVIGLALVLTACGGGPGPQPGISPAETTATQTGGEPAGDLQAALLTTADMPPGFVVAEDMGDAQMSAGCPALEADPESSARAHAQVLFKMSELGPFIRERLLELSPERAQGLIATIRSAVDVCRHFTSNDKTVGTIEFSVSTLSMDTMGDATTAIRITGRPAIVNLPLFQDLVVVRHGGVIMLISHVASSSIDTDLTTSTAQRAFSKLRSRR